MSCKCCCKNTHNCSSNKGKCCLRNCAGYGYPHPCNCACPPSARTRCTRGGSTPCDHYDGCDASDEHNSWGCSDHNDCDCTCPAVGNDSNQTTWGRCYRIYR